MWKKIKLVALLAASSCGSGTSLSVEKCAPAFVSDGRPYFLGSSVSSTIFKDSASKSKADANEREEAAAAPGTSNQLGKFKYNFICNSDLCNSPGYEPGTAHSDRAWTKSEYTCSVSSFTILCLLYAVEYINPVSSFFLMIQWSHAHTLLFCI